MLRALILLLLTPVICAAETARITTFTHDFTKTYLIRFADKSVLIDPGGSQNARRVVADLRATGIAPEKLSAIIVTHGHTDHADAARYFQQTHGVPVIAGAGDLPLFQAGRNDQLCPTGRFARNRRARDQAARFTPFQPNILISEPYRLKDLPLKITPLPGHTPGSLIIQIGNAVFVGDLFRGATILGAARHFYMCDLADNTSDIMTLLSSIAPDGQVFYPGHFPPASRADVERLAARLKP